MNIISKCTDNARKNFKIKISDAEQKDCNGEGKVREKLCAEWNNTANNQAKVVAIGINPSTAHNGKSDNTITKLCRFLDMYGFNNLSMLNLYENVSSTQLNEHRIITDFNTKREILKEADIILIVWGFDEKNNLRDLKLNAGKVLSDYSDKLYCIKDNNNKFPAHPSRLHYNWSIVPYDKHLVCHHNMYGPSCEVASGNNEEDFKIYCRKKHKICIPKNCDKCKYFGGSEMGKGVCCIWEESYKDIKGIEHPVQHNEVFFEFKRVDNLDIFKK